MSELNVAVTPDIEVKSGQDTTLSCHYFGVTNPNLLEVTWTHKWPGKTSSLIVWKYDGTTSVDSSLGEQNQVKFERVQTRIAHAHAIKLKNASFEDDGEYSCKVTYYRSSDGDSFYRGEAALQLTVTGK